MAGIGEITIPVNFEITETSKAVLKGLIAEVMLDAGVHKQLAAKSKITEIDAAINGPLVEVGQIYGKLLYIRDDTHDPEQLRYLVEQIQSAFRQAFYISIRGDRGDESEKITQ